MSNCLCDGWLATSTHYAGIFLSCCVSSMMRASFYSVDHCFFINCHSLLYTCTSHISYAPTLLFKIYAGKNHSIFFVLVYNKRRHSNPKTYSLVVVTCGVVYFLSIVTHFFVFVMGNVCSVYKPRSLHDTEYIGMCTR